MGFGLLFLSAISVFLSLKLILEVDMDFLFKNVFYFRQLMFDFVVEMEMKHN